MDIGRAALMFIKIKLDHQLKLVARKAIVLIVFLEIYLIVVGAKLVVDHH